MTKIRPEKTRNLHVKLTQADKHFVEKASAAIDLSQTQYIRRLIRKAQQQEIN